MDQSFYSSLLCPWKRFQIIFLLYLSAGHSKVALQSSLNLWFIPFSLTVSHFLLQMCGVPATLDSGYIPGSLCFKFLWLCWNGQKTLGFLFTRLSLEVRLWGDGIGVGGAMPGLLKCLALLKWKVVRMVLVMSNTVVKHFDILARTLT